MLRTTVRGVSMDEDNWRASVRALERLRQSLPLQFFQIQSRAAAFVEHYRHRASEEPVFQRLVAQASLAQLAWCACWRLMAATPEQRERFFEAVEELPWPTVELTAPHVAAPELNPFSDLPLSEVA